MPASVASSCSAFADAKARATSNCALAAASMARFSTTSASRRRASRVPWTSTSARPASSTVMKPANASTSRRQTVAGRIAATSLIATMTARFRPGMWRKAWMRRTASLAEGPVQMPLSAPRMAANIGVSLTLAAGSMVAGPTAPRSLPSSSPISVRKAPAPRSVSLKTSVIAAIR